MKIFQKAILLVSLIILNFQSSAQNVEKENPILYIETFAGGFTGKTKGVLWGADINYQITKNLLTLRYSQITDVGTTFTSFVPIPQSTTNAYADEIAILYGRRKINNGHSISISIGPSYNIYSLNSIYTSEKQKVNALGAAFETNIKWFKKEKINPFGFSYGIKLSGNISKNNYIGLSFMIGIGWHKIYN